MGALSTVFIDVGGVLWHFHDEDRARQERARRLAQAVALPDGQVERLLDALYERTEGVSELDRFDVLAAVRDVVADLDLDGVDLAAVRRAMCVPAAGWVQQDPGIGPFLASLRTLGLGRVILSNVVWRAAEDYWRDFAEIGVAHDIDAVVSSLDALVRKPNPLIFQIALEVAGSPLPSTCVMIGDTEDKDITPARALGMYTVRMAPDGVDSRADAVVGSLEDAASVIAEWHDEPPIRAVTETQIGALRVFLANDSPEERRVRDVIADLVERHEIGPYLFTDRVVIDQDAREAHSHPVLTLRTRFSVRTPIGVLATLVHEQLHWHLTGREDAVRAAIDDLVERYPEVPGREQGGARNPMSTYLHLIVNWLEHEALIRLVGEAEAIETTRAHVFYGWIYRTVLEDGDAIGTIVRKRGLALDG